MRILEMLNAEPDITVQELRHELSESGVFFGNGTIHRFLNRYGTTRKTTHLIATKIGDIIPNVALPIILAGVLTKTASLFWDRI